MNEKYNPMDYFEYRTLVAGIIISSQEYQRDVSNHHVKSIQKDFDPYQVNPVKVAFRDGKYYLFDGQHTLNVLITLFGINTYVPAMVFKNVSKTLEAKLFSEQDVHKRRLKVEEVLNAKYCEGDNRVVEFKEIIDSFGFDCDFVASKQDGKLSAYSYLWKDIYGKNGSQRLINILHITKKAWGVTSDAVSIYALKALNVFLDYYNHMEYSEKTLVTALRKMTPEKMKLSAYGDNTRNQPEALAAQVVTAYNSVKGVRQNGKLQIKF